MIRKLLIHAVKEITKTTAHCTLGEGIDTKQVIDSLTCIEGPLVNDMLLLIASTFLKCRLINFIIQEDNVLLPKVYRPY